MADLVPCPRPSIFDCPSARLSIWQPCAAKHFAAPKALPGSVELNSMPKIIFIEFGGTEHAIEAQSGISLMQVARQFDVPGIEAECGGARTCATCHVYVRPDWLAVTGVADAEERELLEFVDDVHEGSRLSCQITVANDMHGLVIDLPESQGFS